MLKFITAVSLLISTFDSGSVHAQVEPTLYMPCKLQVKAESNWSEIGQNYAKHYKRTMPMTATKRCDLSFLRSSDSMRFRISFCHEKPKSSALMQTDSTFSKQIGDSRAQFTRVRMNGRVLYDLEVSSKGCSHSWGTIIRADELPAMESLLRDLSLKDAGD